ncbi:MAG TPA: GNAT family N-acetyltransferase [Gaiellaceae bacterium]|nr:GNAT family N-acetyltransferase [Gaiellaceae bacterium]
MRIAVIGPSGSGKTRLSTQLANALRLRHVEIDALHHGPNWESCTPDELRERVAAATAGDDWVSDGTYHQMIGELVLERAQIVAWLDLPVRLVVRRLVRRTYVRKKHRVELWHGNVEGPWRASLRHLVWPACKRGFENRRRLPALFGRHPHLEVHRLRTDDAVRAFVAAMQRTAALALPSERLTTERLVLEPLDPAHAVEMAGVLDDPELHRYTGGEPLSLEDLRRRYEIQARGRSADGAQRWLNWVVRASGEAVGCVQATVGVESGSAEVAWVMGTRFQGRGYAQEAAGAMLSWLRDHGVSRVVAHIHPGNRASEGVARRLGLTPTATIVDGEVRWQDAG